MRDVQTPMVGTDLSELKGKILDFLRQDRTTRPNLGNVNNLYEVIRYYATRTNELVGILGGGDEDDTDETPTHLAGGQPPVSGSGSGSVKDKGSGSGSAWDRADADQEEADADIFRTQRVDKTYADYKDAVRQSQAASQAATQARAVQQRDERQQVRKREQRAKRENYVRRTGRRATCPIMTGSKACNGGPCHDRYPDEKFDHPAVCTDKTHIVRGEVGGCLLFNFWPNVSKNSRGGTSGRYSGGYPRQTGKPHKQGNAPWQGNAPRQGTQVVDSKEVQRSEGETVKGQNRSQVGEARQEADICRRWPRRRQHPNTRTPGHTHPCSQGCRSSPPPPCTTWQTYLPGWTQGWL
jgi:hypothetical protein